MRREGWTERQLHGGRRDRLVREEPLVLDLGGQTLVTMRTPGADEDLALGFVLSEGLAPWPGPLPRLHWRKGGDPRAEEDAAPDRVVVELSPELLSHRQERLRRMQELRASCGLCGVTELRELRPDGSPLRPHTPRIDSSTLRSMLDAFHSKQDLFETTGGCHGAALMSPSAELLGFGEDIGRHNALDKAIGQCARQGHDFGEAIALLSGRAGYELVAKLLRLGTAIIVSVSAASALSFDLCREAGATLVGFARGERLSVYWDEGRLVAPSPQY